MSRPKPTVILEHINKKTYRSEQVLVAEAIWSVFYKDEPFVDVMPAGSHPQTRSVKASNVCRLSVVKPENSNTVVVLSVIDNLCKGASGQAVQNMNIMFGFDEKAGLQAPALLP